MEQMKVVPTARWTVTQPWRGLFGVLVTLGLALIITACFDMATYTGFAALLFISMVPVAVVMTLGLGGKYPPTEGWPQAWRGLGLTAFVYVIGLIGCFALLNFVSAGVAQPFSIIYLIATVCLIFYPIIAFGMWPLGKMSLPAKGFLTLIGAYVIMFFGFKLFNFSMLSYPTGVNPSPIGPVPFYAEGGPLAPFAAIAPMGPFAWESAYAFWFWMVAILLTFPLLGMWPFSKSPGLMKQPVMGIVVTLSCGALAALAYFIWVGVMKAEPIRFSHYGISYVFGILMVSTMLQNWPGGKLKQPLGGFVNVLLGIVIGIISFYAIGAFCSWHFGEAMVYPGNIFAVDTVMLGLTFPFWAMYLIFWDFWPLPPTPAPPGSQLEIGEV